MPPSGSTCDASTLGQLVYSSNVINICEGSFTSALAAATPISPQNPASSCAAIQSAQLPAGYYYIGTVASNSLTYCVNGFPIPSQILVNGVPAMYFPFDATSGVQDVMGNTVTMYSTVTVSGNIGRAGNAAYFDGSGSYLTVDSLSSAFWASAYTVGVWVNFYQTNRGSVTQAVFSFGPGTSLQGLHISERNGGTYFGFYVSDCFSNWNIRQSVWVHVVFSYDGANTRSIYVNGVLRLRCVVLNAAFIVGNSGPSFIGKNSFDNNVLYGLLDDLVVYDRALTDTAVNTLFNSYGISNLGSTTTCAGVNTLAWPPGTYTLSGENSGSPAYCYNGRASYLPPFSTIGYPYAYYPMDANPLDAFNVLDGSLFAGSQTVQTACRVNNCLNFNGATSYVFNNIPNTFVRGATTIAFWGRLSQLKSSFNGFFGHGTAACTNNICFHIMERSTRPYYGFFSNDYEAASTTLAINTWYHFVWTHDGVGGRSIYLNGVLQSLTPGGTIGAYTGSGSFSMGNLLWMSSPFSYLNGFLDDVIFWSSVLTPAQISTLYNSYTGVT